MTPKTKKTHNTIMDWLDSGKKFLETAKQIGYERERSTVAQLAVAFFALIYFLVSLNAPDGWGPAFVGLSLCYLAAFLALGSRWFWARWFAGGLGWSGAMVGVMSLVMVGWHPALGIYTLFHGLVVAMLRGKKVAALYELQPAWQKRFDMDEFGVTRLGKAVTRGSASLPTLILWALAPRDGEGTLLTLVGLVLAISGLAAILRLRTWGLLALGAAAASVVGVALVFPDLTLGAQSTMGLEQVGLWQLLGSPAVAAGWTAAALLPFVVPIWKALRLPVRR